MNGRFTINLYKLFTVFVVLFPICPVYFFFQTYSVRDLLIYGFSLICVVFRLKSGFTIRTSKRIIPFLVSMVVSYSILAVVQIIHAEYSLAAKQIIMWILIAVICSQIIKTKEQFLSIIDTLILVGIIIGIFGIVEEFTHYNVFEIFNTYNGALNYNASRLGIFRIISFTSHAITYSLYCMFLLTLTFYRIMTSKKRIFIIAYIIFVMNIIFTLSRSVIMITIGSQLLLLFLCGYQKFVKTVLKLLFIGIVLVVIACLFSQQIRNMLVTSWYVFMAIFDSSYVPILRSMGFTDNTAGIGNRFDLYGWVFQQLKPNYLLGKGRYGNFSVNIVSSGYSTVKTSIEVEWLQTLFRYGFVGLISEVYFYIKALGTSRKGIKRETVWENKISFSKVMFVILVAYVCESFAMMFNNEQQLFLIIVILFLAYNINDGFSEEII